MVDRVASGRLANAGRGGKSGHERRSNGVGEYWSAEGTGRDLSVVFVAIRSGVLVAGGGEGAIDGDGCSGYERGGIRRQEEGDFGDIVWCADAA